MNADELKYFRESLEKNAGIPGAGFVKGTYNVLRHPVRSLRSAKDFVLWGKKSPGAWGKRFKSGLRGSVGTGLLAGTVFTGGAVIAGTRQPRLLSGDVVNRNPSSLGGGY